MTPDFWHPSKNSGVFFDKIYSTTVGAKDEYSLDGLTLTSIVNVEKTSVLNDKTRRLNNNQRVFLGSSVVLLNQQ